MFSGQGSQYYQMGKELYNEHPRFKLWMDYCDEIVSPLIGTSLVDIIYQEELSVSEPFDQLLYSNPALLCIEYSLSRVLMEMNTRPDYLIGYSLGEITASIVAGAMSLSEGLELVVDYAKLINKNENQAAGMLSIFDSVNIMTELPELFQNCTLTGKNFAGNFVVCGLQHDIQRLQQALDDKKIVSQRLAVNYAFHTQMMDVFEDDFKRLASKVNLSSVRIPIISSSTTGGIHEVTENYLWNVVRNPVEFEKTIHLTLNKGDFTFIDVGPSGSLATFVKYILPANSNSNHLEMINQFGRNLKSIEKLKAGLSTLTSAST